MSDRVILTSDAVVGPDQVFAGRVVVENGCITEVTKGGHVRGDDGVELGPVCLLPGLIDLHNDGLEQQINPRPAARFDPAVALLHFDRQLLAGGVTTEFHAVYFADVARTDRSMAGAVATASAVRTLGPRVGFVDHQVLHRWELRNTTGLEQLFAALEAAQVRYLSLNDHVPGVGQYRNLPTYSAVRRALGGASAVSEEVDEQRAAELHRIDPTAGLSDVLRIVQELGVAIASHDDDTIEHVELMHALGVRIAEFPVTFEAARRARELGMLVGGGAPNLVRGGSLTGNLNVGELAETALLDYLCSDYYVPALLAAVFQLAPRHGLAAATRLATLGPAAAIGLDEDRGAIAPGKRGDLIAVRADSTPPHVTAVWVNGCPVYQIGVPTTSGVVRLAPPRDSERMNGPRMPRRRPS